MAVTINPKHPELRLAELSLMQCHELREQYAAVLAMFGARKNLPEPDDMPAIIAILGASAKRGAGGETPLTGEQVADALTPLEVTLALFWCMGLVQVSGEKQTNQPGGSTGST
jgi:hypothetical protein